MLSLPTDLPTSKSLPLAGITVRIVNQMSAVKMLQLLPHCIPSSYCGLVGGFLPLFKVSRRVIV